jgi:uncharacterized surface protein with fasciclin (FAS1) repeats
MRAVRLLTAASAVALLASPVFAQEAAAPAAPPAPAAAAPASQGDVIDTLRAQGKFNTFLKAVDAAQLTDVIKGLKAVTLFAPTDEAFAALPPGTVETWLKPENKDALRSVVLYHVINASVSSSQLAKRKGPVRTGSDKEVLLDGSGPVLKANDANVITADIKSTNGAIFAIDKVLNPDDAAKASAAAAPAAPPSGGMAFNRDYVVRASWQDPTPPPADPDPTHRTDNPPASPAPESQAPTETPNPDSPAPPSQAPEASPEDGMAPPPADTATLPTDKDKPVEEPKEKKPHH